MNKNSPKNINQNLVGFKHKSISPENKNLEKNKNLTGKKYKVSNSNDIILNNKFKTNKNLKYNFNECINIENYYKNEEEEDNIKIKQADNNKLTYQLDIKEIESSKKRLLSPEEKPIITKNILNILGDSYRNNEIISGQKYLSYKDDIININNYQNGKNLKNNELLSDLDNDSDTRAKIESEKNNEQNNKTLRKSHLKLKKKESYNFNRRRSSQSLYRMDNRKNRLDTKKKTLEKNTNYDESSNLLNYIKRDIYILNFNLFAELDQMEKIETKSKETFLVRIIDLYHNR